MRRIYSPRKSRTLFYFPAKENVSLRNQKIVFAHAQIYFAANSSRIRWSIRLVEIRLKDMKLSRGDFGRRGRKLKELNYSPKKRFDAAQNIDHRLTFEEIAAAMHEVCTENESIIFTAEFKEESQDKHPEVDKTNIMTLSDFLSASTTQEEFCFKMQYFPEHLAEIE